MNTHPPPMKLVGKPEVSSFTPATTGEIVRDTLRFWCFLLPAGLLTLSAGVIARILCPWPLGMLIIIGAMAITALLLWKPMIWLYHRWFGAYLETHGPMRWGTFVLGLTFVLLPLMTTGAFFGVGSLDITLGVIGPLGFGLVGTGFALRSGESRHCPSCDYQVPPEGEIPSEICPECGTNWTQRLVQGRRVKSPFLIRLGTVLVVLWIVPVFTSFIGLAPFVYRATPSALLIPWTKTTSSYSPKLLPRLTELAGRPLTPDQKTSLAHHMLNRRMREGNSPFPAAAWLDGLVTVPNAAPETLRNRYFFEAFSPKLDIPRTVVAGESTMLQVTGTFRGTFHTLWPWARIEAITVNFDDLQAEFPTNWTYALYLDASRGPFRDPNIRSTLEVPWTPQQAGAHTIRVTIRLASTPQGTTPAALDDPATPIIWTEVLDLEATVIVAPPGNGQP